VESNSSFGKCEAEKEEVKIICNLFALQGNRNLAAGKWKKMKVAKAERNLCP